MSNTLVNDFNSLKEEVHKLNREWKTFNQLFATSDERMKIISSTAGTFFSIIQITLVESIMLTISRLTENKRVSNTDTLTLSRIISGINKTVDKTTSSALLESLNDIKIKHEPIRKWRDNVYAHRNYEKATNPMNNPLPKVTYKNLAEIISKINDLMNNISDQLGLEYVLYDAVQISGDADELVSFLKMGLSFSSAKFDLLQSMKQISDIIHAI